ncbi:Rieske (2Fe-2S) protein [Luteococcus sediminum]
MSPTRRDVLKTAGLAAGAATGAAGLTGCSSPETIAEGPATIKAAEVPVGGAVIVEDSRFVVAQPTAGQFKAFDRLCPHAGCDVTRVEKSEIVCTCHDARFSAADGSVLSGPAETGLSGAMATLDGEVVTLREA